MSCLDRAFLMYENTSLLVLARSKQTIHSLITRVVVDCEEKLKKHDITLKVVRVNTTLLDANENKILQKFAEVLELPTA